MVSSDQVVASVVPSNRLVLAMAHLGLWEGFDLAIMEVDLTFLVMKDPLSES